MRVNRTNGIVAMGGRMSILDDIIAGRLPTIQPRVYDSDGTFASSSPRQAEIQPLNLNFIVDELDHLLDSMRATLAMETMNSLRFRSTPPITGNLHPTVSFTWSSPYIYGNSFYNFNHLPTNGAARMTNPAYPFVFGNSRSDDYIENYDRQAMFINHDACMEAARHYSVSGIAHEMDNLTDWEPYNTDVQRQREREERARQYAQLRVRARERTEQRMRANTPSRMWRYNDVWQAFSAVDTTAPEVRREGLLKQIKHNRLVGKKLAERIAKAKEDSDYWKEVLDYIEVTFKRRTFMSGQALRQTHTIRSKSNMMATLWDNYDEALESVGYMQCADCSTIVHEIDAHYIESEDHHVCESCLQDSYIWSDLMSEYLPEDEAVRVYPSQRAYDHGDVEYATREFLRMGDFRWSDVADAYVHESVYVEEDDEDDEDDWDSDDDDDYSRDGLRDYHGARRDFVIINKTPNVPFKGAPALGLELEVYANDSRRDAVTAVKEMQNVIGGLILERDGSLDEEQGFEIISDPLGFTEWQDFGPRLCKTVSEEADCIAYTAEGQYGIHLTFDNTCLTALQQARMMMFMSSEENADFVRVIAQRKNIYRGDIDIGSLGKEDQKIFRIGGLSNNYAKDERGRIKYDKNNNAMYVKQFVGKGKYCPINLKGNLCEVRIFRATLHPESFMKNIEFIYAMIEWLRGSTGNSWHYMDFVKWLGKRPRVAKDYPHLLTYLRRPKFGIRHSSSKITNNWLSLLPKTKEELAELDLEEAA